MLRHVTLHRVISRTILLTGLLSWGKPRLDAQSSAPSRDLVLFNNATIDLVRVYLVDRGSQWLLGRLLLVVRKDLRLTWPRAETPTHFITMGMDKDLTKATQIAVQQAIDFVAAYRGWSKMEAYRLVSVACDVRITELVDGNVGVHVMIPKAVVGSRTSP